MLVLTIDMALGDDYGISPSKEAIYWAGILQLVTLIAIGIIISFISMVLSYGLLKLNRCAWIMTLIQQIIVVLFWITVDLFAFSKFPFIFKIIQIILGLIIPIVIIYYLLKQDVRQAFSRRKIA